MKSLATYQRQHRADRFARGLCGDCVNKARPGKRHCADCATKRKLAHQRWLMKRERIQVAHG